MKIVYFGKFKNNPYSKIEEEEISKALKQLGHKVLEFDIAEANAKELIETANKSNLFLFHNGGVETESELKFLLGLEGLKKILSSIKCEKVFWFFEKTLGLGRDLIYKISPFVDCGFLNDDTFVRRIKDSNLSGLHLGTSKKPLGKHRKDLECDIAFIGRIYGERINLTGLLKREYGRKFRIFENIWGQEFDDLCQSAKIIVSPRFPMDDFCWNSQIYQVLGSGGFLIHPRLYGLKEEGFEDGGHYVGYTFIEEVLAEIEFFLKPENDEKYQTIKKQGRDLVLKKFTWEERLRDMFWIIKREKLNK